ncbi:MAG: hypothetical protein ABFE07_00680 [Armatimonadia bacterium]
MIVGISGYAGSGKSTVAAHLVEHLDGAVEVNFADELRQMAIRMFGAAPHNVYGSHEGRNFTLPCGVTAREVLQQLGDSVRRVWPDSVVYAWANRLVEAYAEYGMVPIVVADVRMRNEAEAIRSRGGIIIRLTRNADRKTERRWIQEMLRWPGAPRRSRSGLNAAVAQHITERDLDRYAFDAVLDNAHMTVADTNAEAMRICREAGIV